MTVAASAFPRTRRDWVVLPLLAAAYEEHDEAEDEHDEAPGEVEVHPHRPLVDRAVAREETVEAHHASGDEEDEAEGDADVETHGIPCWLRLRAYLRG